MLGIFRSFEILSWKDLAHRILESGVVRGKVGGYMNRNHVNDWLCETYNISPLIAEKTISKLIEKHMID